MGRDGALIRWSCDVCGKVETSGEDENPDSWVYYGAERCATNHEIWVCDGCLTTIGDKRSSLCADAIRTMCEILTELIARVPDTEKCDRGILRMLTLDMVHIDMAALTYASVREIEPETTCKVGTSTIKSKATAVSNGSEYGPKARHAHPMGIDDDGDDLLEKSSSDDSEPKPSAPSSPCSWRR